MLHWLLSRNFYRTINLCCTYITSIHTGLRSRAKCCCQLVWQKWTNQISIFLFRTSINLFRSWRTIIRNKLIRISLFFMNVCQLRNKFMLVRNKNILIWFVHSCQNTWQQHKRAKTQNVVYRCPLLKSKQIADFFWKIAILSFDLIDYTNKVFFDKRADLLKFKTSKRGITWFTIS